MSLTLLMLQRPSLCRGLSRKAHHPSWQQLQVLLLESAPGSARGRTPKSLNKETKPGDLAGGYCIIKNNDVCCQSQTSWAPRSRGSGCWMPDATRGAVVVDVSALRPCFPGVEVGPQPRHNITPWLGREVRDISAMRAWWSQGVAWDSNRQQRQRS